MEMDGVLECLMPYIGNDGWRGHCLPALLQVSPGQQSEAPGAAPGCFIIAKRFCSAMRDSRKTARVRYRFPFSFLTVALYGCCFLPSSPCFMLYQRRFRK